MAARPRRLFVVHGDGAGGTLRRALLAQDRLEGTAAAIERDVFSQGPLVRDHDEVRRVRFDYWSEHQDRKSPSSRRKREATYARALSRAPKFDQVVVGASDVLDSQLFLVELLSRPVIRELGNLFLIHTGARRLELLPLEEAVEALRDADPVSERQLADAVTAWEALTSTDPRALSSLAVGPEATIPGLTRALGRMVENYPSLGDGLARLQREILTALRGGRLRMPKVFLTCQDEEPLHSVGGDELLDGVLGLRASNAIACHGFPERKRFRRALLWAVACELTRTGEELHAGREDWTRIGVVDRWVGGVHLTDGRWRFDPGTREIVRSAASPTP